MTSPLENITILDLTRLLPGPYCTMILADMGANVIRVQNPRYIFENLPPFYEKGREKRSILSSILMRNKQSISLDLKNPHSLEIFYRLVKKADVVIEGYRPDVTKRLKIDYQTLKQLNPGIIYCALTGYGQTGPYRDKPGHDLNFAGVSGSLNLNRQAKIKEDGYDPKKPIPMGTQFADLGGSLYSTIGILGALINKLRNPQHGGEFIDISMLDCAFALNPLEASLALSKDPNSRLYDIVHDHYPAYNIYRTKDHKYLTTCNSEQKFWDNFCEIMDLQKYRAKAWSIGPSKEKIFEILEEKFLTKDLSDWMELFETKDLCIMPILSYKDALENPQITHRSMVVKQNHPIFGEILNIGTPIKYQNNPITTYQAAPQMGQHTIDVLQKNGYSSEEIENLQKLGCFGK